jgi:hypothetical protein
MQYERTEAHPGRSESWQPSHFPAHPLGDGVVTLRPWTEADLPAIEAATRDPEIFRRNRLPQSFDAAAWFEESSVEQE